MKKWFVLLLGWSLQVSAIQVYPVKNGSEIRASIYESGLSRVVLQDDRIMSIKGLAGEFMIDKNEEIGDIYIKPLATRQGEELNLFIQSEKGNTYALILTPDSSKPEIIRLDASDLIEKIPAASLPQGEPEQALIIELIKIASEGIEIKGYSSETYEAPSPLSLRNKVVAIVEKSYFGKKYRVDVLKISNQAKHEISVHERDLGQGQEVVAVSVEKRVLSPKESTQAYRVVKS